MASKYNGGVLRVKRTFLSYYYYNYAQCRSSLASFSSSIEPAEARNAAAEATGDSSVGTGGTYNNNNYNTGAPDPTRQEKHDEDDESGLTGYATEMLKGGAEMAKDVTDKVCQTVKSTVDGSVKAMEQMKLKATEEERRGPNYRMDAIDDREKTIEDLRRRAGGYDTTQVK